MDLTTTTAPRSDQQNFDDYVAGPKVVTIAEVTPGTAEQPAEVHLVEFPGRPYKPSKSMRRVLVAAWGPDTTTYTGRRMKLVGDPTVKFGGNVVGGIKIAALSDIEKPVKVQLTVTRGKRAPHVVEVLSEAAAQQQPTPEPTHEQVESCDDIDVLKRMWQASSPERRQQIEGRVRELRGVTEAADSPDTLPTEGSAS